MDNTQHTKHASSFRSFIAILYIIIIIAKTSIAPTSLANSSSELQQTKSFGYSRTRGKQLSLEQGNTKNIWWKAISNK